MAATRRTATRKARKPLKGRALVAIGLLVFFVVSSANISRRSLGIKTARELDRMRQEQRTLLAQEKSFENELRKATSRRTVVQEAQKRLNMIRPSEAQVRFLAAPAGSAAAPDSVEQP
jgi:type II secretory pathway component PulK